MSCWVSYTARHSAWCLLCNSATSLKKCLPRILRTSPVVRQIFWHMFWSQDLEMLEKAELIKPRLNSTQSSNAIWPTSWQMHIVCRVICHAYFPNENVHEWFLYWTPDIGTCPSSLQEGQLHIVWEQFVGNDWFCWTAVSGIYQPALTSLSTLRLM